MKHQFKSRKDTSKYLAEKGIDTSNWTEEKWLSINKGQAEIHMMALAEAMLQEYNKNTPTLLQVGEWHIPFGDNIGLNSTSDKTPLEKLSKKINHTSMAYSEDMEQLAIKIATARCARISYMTFDREINYEKDLELHDSLLTSGHMSPFEHCAKVMSEDEREIYTTCDNNGTHYAKSDNFTGFIQYRKMIVEENKSDNRINIPLTL